MTVLRARWRAVAAGLTTTGAVAVLGLSLTGHATALAPDAAASFTVLKAPAGDGQSLFATAPAAQLAQLRPGAAVPDLATARTVAAGVAGSLGQARRISVAKASNGQVCFSHQATGDVDAPVFTACAPVPAAQQSGLVSVTHPAPGPGVQSDAADVVALVPDGVPSVSFPLADGTSQTVAVHNNTAVAHLDAPVAMSFALNGATHTTSLEADAR